MDKLLFITPFSFPILALLACYYQRPVFFTIITLAWGLVLMALDMLLPRDAHYPWQEVRDRVRDDSGRFQKSNFILFVFVLSHLLALAASLYRVSQAANPWPWMLLIVPVCLSGMESLAIAHELMHGRSGPEALMSRIASIPQMWNIHEYEHLYLHHRDEVICTEIDTSYAPLGKSVYGYIAMGLVSNIRNAWQIQYRLLKEKGAPLPGLQTLARTYLPSIVLAVLVGVFLGKFALAFFLIQSAASILLGLGATYNQHYGLTRRKRGDGSYEPFTYMNVWSSDGRISNRLFWNIPHHAHHHLDPFCDYPELKFIADSPTLPNGLFSMTLSFFPPLWFRIMNPRVKDVFTLRDRLDSEGRL